MEISHAPCTFIPIAVTSNLWTIPSNPHILGSTMTIISPDEATSTVPLQQAFHILKLSPAYSATSTYFHLAPHYADDAIMINIFLDTAK